MHPFYLPPLINSVANLYGQYEEKMKTINIAENTGIPLRIVLIINRGEQTGRAREVEVFGEHGGNVIRLKDLYRMDFTRNQRRAGCLV